VSYSIRYYLLTYVQYPPMLFTDPSGITIGKGKSMSRIGFTTTTFLRLAVHWYSDTHVGIIMAIE